MWLFALEEKVLMLCVRKKMEGQQKGLHLPGKVAACRLEAERLGTPYDSQCCHSEALGSSKPEQMCPGRPDTGPGERLDLAEALLEVSSAALASWPHSSPRVKMGSTTESLLVELCCFARSSWKIQGFILVPRSWCLYTPSKGLRSK